MGFAGRILALLVFAVAVLSSNPFWGADQLLYDGTPGAFDVDVASDGRVFAAVAASDTLHLMVSENHGESFDDVRSVYLGFTPGLVRVIAAMGDSNFLYVFYVGEDDTLRVLRVPLSLSGEEQVFAVASHVEGRSFSVTRDTRGQYGLYVAWLTGQNPFIDSLNFARSFDHGVTWEFMNLKRNFWKPGVGVDIAFYPPEHLYVTWATCWGDTVDEKMEILLYGSDSLGEPGSWWGYTRRITENDSMDWNPHMSVAGDMSNPTIWIVYNHVEQVPGNLSVCFSVCDTSGVIGSGLLSENAWGVEDYPGFVRRRFAPIDTVEVAYVSLGVNSGAKYRSVSSADPFDWADPLLVSDHPPVFSPGLAPKVLFAPSDTVGFSLYFYASSDGIYYDRNPVVAVEEETSSISTRIIVPNVLRPGGLFDVPSSFRGQELSLFDVSGRLMARYPASLTRSGSLSLPSDLSAGIYFMRGEKEALKLLVR